MKTEEKKYVRPGIVRIEQRIENKIFKNLSPYLQHTSECNIRNVAWGDFDEFINTKIAEIAQTPHAMVFIELKKAINEEYSRRCTCGLEDIKLQFQNGK